MFGPLGLPELIFIMVLALLIFGPRKLPEIGRTLGRGLAEFRKASSELKRSIDAEMMREELRQSDPRNLLREEPQSKRADTSNSSTRKGQADAQDPITADSSASRQHAAPDATVARGSSIDVEGSAATAQQTAQDGTDETETESP